MVTDAPVALVTGAAKRIGAAISRHLHRRGFNVALHYGRSRQEAATLAIELNAERANSAVIFQADITDLDAVTSLAEAVESHWGRVDTLVNNASTFYPTPLADATATQWAELIDSNLKGAFFLARALAPALRQQRGSIVNITDINVRHPLKDYPIYCIAKAGKAMLTRSLARDLAPEINVNGVAPGSILWPEGAAAMDDDAKNQLLAQIPLGRPGTPEDIAEMVGFLAAAPGYLTGQIIAVDGGLSLNGEQGWG